MKKLLTTIALTTMIVSSAAAATQVQKEHKWSVKFTGYTTNANMPDEWNDLEIGYKLALRYQIDKNFYVQGQGVMESRDHYRFEPKIGFMFTLVPHLKPYIESSAIFYSYHGSDNRAFNYDAGVQFDIYKGFYVAAETGNFFESDYGYYKFKAGLPIAKDVVLSGSYDLRYKGHYNGVSVSVDYLI